MKTLLPKSPILKSLLAGAALSLASGAASAQTSTLISATVQDGGFESITAKSNFIFQNSPTNAIPYWGATGVTDAGAEQAAVATVNDNSATHSGTAGAFFQPNASTAFNLAVGRTIQLGDQYTLTWYGRLTGATGQQTLTLFTQSTANTQDTTLFSYIPTATVLTASGVTDPAYSLNQNRAFNLYTVNYTATAADVGNYLGFTIGNSGTSFIGEDDFTLTVTAAVPEPSTYAYVIAGVAGLMLVRRLRRVTV